MKRGDVAREHRPALSAVLHITMSPIANLYGEAALWERRLSLDVYLENAVAKGGIKNLVVFG